MIVPEARVEKALHELSELIEPLATAVSRKEYLDDKKKIIKNRLIADMGKTLSMAAKESAAYAHPDYEEVCKEYRDACYDVEIMRGKKLLEEAVHRTWQTESANARG